jgi:sporulation protein YlmC with PRC-barrel domain
MAQLPSQSQFGDYGEWPGRDVLDSGGERLGGVREIYLDRETGRPEWVLVDVDGDEARFVPLADASVESSTIRVAHSAAAIRNAPGIGPEPRIDQSEERRLYDHYGLGYSEADSGSGLPTDAPTREHPAGAAPTAWGAPDAETTEEPTSSWSAAAGEEPTNVAPAPAEPPPPDEIEAADIPEPPAVSDRASDFEATSTVSADPLRADTDALAPSDEGDLTAQPGPDNVGVFSPPPPPTPPAAPVTPPPRAQTPPPAPEPPSGGAVEVAKSRKASIAAGIAVAALLFFIVRRLR